MSNLTENFKVKNGLTVTSTISAGGAIEADSYCKHDGTSSQFLKADGSVDSTGYTTCTGTTTPSNSQTFTNKCGNISQWTNNSGYTTCAGDVTGIDAGTAITVSDGATATPTVGVTSSCNTAWNNKTTCTGTVTGISAGALLSASGSATCPVVGVDSGALDYLNQSACAGILCTGTTTASNTQTFTNKCGSNNQWVNDAGYTTCTGDVTGIDAGTAIVIGDGGTATPSVGVTSACNTAWNNKTTCTGTVTCVSTGPYLTGGASTSGEIGIDSACASKWDTAAAGDISAVVAGTNLTGGGTSGSVTLNMATGGVGAGTYGDDATGCKIDTITVDAYGRVTAVACGTTGDITGVTAGALLSGGATSGSATLGIDSGALNYLNQSACAGILCTGTTTPSNTQTFTNKSGNISQWTNDSGYLTSACSGTVTSVTRGNGIDGSGSITSTGTIAVGEGTGITVGTNDVSLAAACRNALASAYTTTSNLSGCPGLDCVGAITCVNAGTNLTGGGTSGCVTVNMATGGAGAGNYGNSSNACKIDTLTLDAYGRITAVIMGPTGDIFGVTAGNGLSGGGTGDTVTLALDGDCIAGLNQSACAGINCTGTTTASNSQTFTNKGGNISQWTNNSGYTTCDGTLNPSGTIATNDFAQYNASGDLVGRSCTETRSDLGINTAANCTAASLNQSACAGILCTGTLVASDISGLTCCTGTTTPSNAQTFTNKGGSNSQWTNDEGFTTCTGTVVASDISSFTSCTGTTTPSNTQTFTNKSGNISQWTNDSGYLTSACTGTVTNVAGCDGITVTNGTGSACVNVDSTVVRTTGNQTVGGCKVFSDNTTIQGNLSVIGDFTYLDTFVNVTSALSIVNNGTGPALEVNQTGTNDIVNFEDDGTSAFYIENGGNVGLGDTNPAHKLDVAGNINATGSYKLDDGDVINSGKCFVGAQVRPTTDIADAYIASAATWNAKTTCTGTLVPADISGLTCCLGTTTPSNTQTFTNKSGSNSQWTNDEGFTTCTGTLVAADISGLTCCLGTTTPSNTQTFTNKSGNISQWTNDSGYTCNTGTLQPSGTIATNDFAKYNASGCLTGRNCTETRSDLGINSAANCTAASLNQSACAGINCTGTLVAGDISGLTCCTGTTTASNTQTFTNKSGSNSQWTNDAGYTCNVGDITAVTTSNGIAGGGSSGSVGICVDSTVIRTTGNQVIGGTKHFTSTVIVPSLSATGTVQANCFAAGAYMEANAPAVEVYPKGTLLALNCDGLIVQSTQEESSMVFGVATGDDQAPIVMGAEPICITGCITVGDFITASSCNGHGKKAICPEFGTVIAQAMESGGGDSYKIKAMIRKI